MNLKKPRFWDYKKPNIYAYLLKPIAFFIQIVSYFKNRFKTPKLNKKKIKTICVGNFYIGGTGKTSLSIKINDILKQKKIRTCFVKKFYKEQKDEQKILKNNGKLFLSLNRADAIAQAENENYQIAVCDDGLQDKSINYDISLVCFNTINWIGNGMTIPSGPMRESINNLKNYHHVFLNGNLENIEEFKKQIVQINSKINVHLGKYEPVNLKEFNFKDKYLAFSGIGNHQTFISMIKKNGLKILKDLEFPDHYQYSKNDIDKITNDANKLNCKIITTEKDFLRFDYMKIKGIKFLKSKLQIIDEEKLIRFLI
ncbi:tetraacyldisaccharide 4'-kinase [Candidatus Pelagibacter communis]|uniref:tetraacyldisaccharide 4'-kinase n=1 Tax=Pelagibacter ubique TaxID=198252 RepID=UPI00094CC1B6|nr:tetraacyldisaccharide 4'-kinase [Candidatus Pelagibacter ubique]